ncbi:xanthine dehydrogenase accessory factor [Actinocorallia herbida]|uniref:Xanthine dehydrogenase accessory factor n=1 Tax=Actinocorallia herbida TaxID=58109 RepID=A0A3N1D6B5_9ACTN|nr:XdhC/CoxI family protein [Actinocorallia herbida]ROO89060.1 xanthine dehydrogenase accessory factor [Actinocorallia herbida]
MREIVERLAAWHRAGTRYALATVIGTGGSAPRTPGAAMAVAEDGEAVGSVSGGCVEGAVYELCLRALETGEPARETFGYSDDTAFAVGLTCGGTIEVQVQPTPPAPVIAAVEAALAVGRPIAVAHLLDGSGSTLAITADGFHGTTGEPDVDTVIGSEAAAMLDAGATGIRDVRCRPGLEVFVSSFATPPRLLIFGAIDYAASVASLGRFLGHRVTVCDARPVFATPARFPDAHEVVCDWPHRYLAATAVDSRTAVVVLTHDAKFDLPLLEVALRLPVGYVGAMGSRRTHAERLARLREAGLTDDELARLRSPIGLDLGARTPEETAVSIVAEIVAARRGGPALPLTATTGPIHRDRLATAH